MKQPEVTDFVVTEIPGNLRFDEATFSFSLIDPADGVTTRSVRGHQLYWSDESHLGGDFRVDLTANSNIAMFYVGRGANGWIEITDETATGERSKSKTLDWADTNPPYTTPVTP